MTNAYAAAQQHMFSSTTKTKLSDTRCSLKSSLTINTTSQSGLSGMKVPQTTKAKNSNTFKKPPAGRSSFTSNNLVHGAEAKRHIVA